MPLYRFISRVVVGDGRCTAFWLDTWHPGDMVWSLLTTLFSYTLNFEDRLAAFLSADIYSALVPHPTSAGEHHLGTLPSLLSGLSLSVVTNDQILTRCRKKTGLLDVRAMYSLRLFGRVLVARS
jgi:hypothetical protein